MAEQLADELVVCSVVPLVGVTAAHSVVHLAVLTADMLVDSKADEKAGLWVLHWAD